MKFLVSLLLIGLAPYVAADHIDTIQSKLRDDCTLQEYLGIVKDFNNWGEGFGYRAEVAVPLQGNDLESIYWLGRSANAQAFGKAWDAWRDGQANPNSTPAKLQARFDQCAHPNQVRNSFDIY